MAEEEPTQPTIAALLVGLADDPSHLEQFRSDPEGVMTRYNLSEGQKEVVRSGNLAAIRAALDYEYRAGLAKGILPGFVPGPQSESDAPGSGGTTMVVTWRVPRPTWG